MSKIIYLAGKRNGKIRSIVKDILLNTNNIIIDPFENQYDWNEINKSSKTRYAEFIYTTDLEGVSHSNIIICIYENNNDNFYFGTTIELYDAILHNIKILVITTINDIAEHPFLITFKHNYNIDILYLDSRDIEAIRNSIINWLKDKL